MSNYVLLLGSNLGDRKDNLLKAVTEIGRRAGNVVARSGIYLTEAWGNTEQQAYFNACIVVASDIIPQDLLKVLLEIEKELGRVRTEVKYEPRTIDIDILFAEDLILNEADLIVPHPHIAGRRFTLMPLNEIMPEFIHPVHRQTISQLFQNCSDPLKCSYIDTL